jgi:hypothetical protein
MKNILQKIRKNSERGQAIILIAFSLVGLVAIVGLMIDGGILLVEYARLKRGIDSASIAAASQYRKGFVGADLEKAGEEFLQFNQAVADVTISTCDYPDTNWDETLCVPFIGPTPRKLVRITASRRVDFGFIRVVGIESTTISATSVGEAASIDMVLVIDTSSSMAYETNGGLNNDPAVSVANPGDDPEICNNHMNDATPDPDLLRRCEPMGKVKDAAVKFVDELFFPYDRVALVASTEQGTLGATRDPYLVPIAGLAGFSTNGSDGKTTDIQNAIRGLRVFQPDRCPTPLEKNLNYTTLCLFFDPLYKIPACIPKDKGVLDPADTTPPYDQPLMVGGAIVRDPTTCGPSNIGGGLYEAGNMFAYARQDSFWAVIALFGGPANASNPVGHVNGLCPGSNNAPTWKLPGGSGFCRDEDPVPTTYNPSTYNPAPVDEGGFDWSTWTTTSRHHYTVDTSTTPNTIIYPTRYDADDYARDGADYITSPINGQGATLYSICMGSYCRDYPNDNDPASAELLGQYMALHAGDSPTSIPPVTANHGLYFYAEDSDVVDDVFGAIAENIFTRISQ